MRRRSLIPVSAALSLPLALASVGGGVVGGVVGGVGGIASAHARSSGHFSHSAMATVFWPNPVQELGNERLTDRKDHDYRALVPAYRRKELTDLDASGTLTGRYAVVKSSTGKAAHLVDGSFPQWHRHADQFEQVMAYYWVTTAQHYLQHLGFGSVLPGVMDRQVLLRINQLGYDNSFFRDDQVSLRFGKGGVDDAEDAEVIVHEYGHAVQNDQVRGFGTNLQSGAIGEGFSDYLAVAVTSWASGVPTKTDEACVADWDSVSYNPGRVHCLRRIDTDRVWPRDRHGEVHADGKIWSSALYDIHQALGPSLAGRVIIGAQFNFRQNTSFRDAAAATVDEARVYGVGRQVRAAFVAHGLL